MTATNRVRVGMVAALASFSLMLAAALPSGAFAFSEFYGGGSLCGSNCYIHSAGAHTFVINEGWSETGSPTLACQLFNGSVNEVSHGSGFCGVNYFGGAFVWARVYNQSNKTYVVTAYAET